MWLSEDGDPALTFAYEPANHALTLIVVDLRGTRRQIPEGACEATWRELRILSPHSAAVEISIDCNAVPLHGLGDVPVIGSIVLDWVEPPG